MNRSLSEQLKQYLDHHRIDYIDWQDGTFTINEIGKFYVIAPKGGDVLDHNFSLIISSEDEQRVGEDETIDYIAFQFGSRWYYSESPQIKELVEIKYLGKELDYWLDPFPFLGIHGGYDLCNGSRQYSDWCKKAKFANYTTLGLCEENTLAGALAFQNACQKAGIKSVIGEQVTVKDDADNVYTVKLYVSSDKGWKNLLNINALINCRERQESDHIIQFVEEKELLRRAEGLWCVINYQFDWKKLKAFTEAGYVGILFQFDVSQWDSEEKDKQMLLATQNYLAKYLDKVPPVLISDAYYLESEDASIRKDLHAIGKVGFKNQSKDQFFKTPNQLFEQIVLMFKDEERGCELFEQAADNAKQISSTNFAIDTGKLHLPQYEMTSEEKSQFSSNEDLFWHLIEQGLQKKVESKGLDVEPYLERIKQEADVILGAKLHDYFLITWDVLNWAHRNGIKTGYGRGSAGGSLVAYLLNIVQTDPIQYGLLFERFLNEGRLYKKKKVQGWEVTDDDGRISEWDVYPADADAMGFKVVEKEIEIKVTGSMPDIDNDIQGNRREDVKRYIEERYGQNRVASIGTYGTFKVKGAIKDLARQSGVDPVTANYVTGAITEDDLTYTGLFKYAQETPVVKSFVQANPGLVEKIATVLGQPKNSSIHAAGVIIVPPSENGIYDQLPVKMVEGVLVSEWEDDYVEQAGFLKLDVLGLKQLDKFAEITELIKSSSGESLELSEIPLDDPKVYKLFGEGKNEDVFQFGGAGLKGYTAELLPETIEDLIATVALYRPGPIDTGAHKQYVARKNGKEKVTYSFKTQPVLKETYGLMCYQEQVMKITQHLAGFTLNEADDIRKAIGKKLPELMAQYKGRFVEGAVNNGCPRNEAEWLWDQIEVFGGYSFNKSHATCYAITGYHCQWFKANYPLEFWTVSLRHAADNQIESRLAEISQTSKINIGAVDINKSTSRFEMDKKTNTIYWTISSVTQVGGAALEAILEERSKNGEYFSVEEFAKRMKPYSRSVKKNTIVNLIFAGAFDEMYQLDSPKQRLQIIENYLNFADPKNPHQDLLKEVKLWKEYQWVLKQKEVSGYALLDFKKMIHQTSLVGKIGKYFSNKQILETDAREFGEVLIAGLIAKIDVKEGNGRPFALVDITDGNSILSGVIWSDTYSNYKQELTGAINKLVVLTAAVKYDNKFKKSNVFNTTDKSLLTIIE